MSASFSLPSFCPFQIFVLLTSISAFEEDLRSMHTKPRIQIFQKERDSRIWCLNLKERFHKRFHSAIFVCGRRPMDLVITRVVLVLVMAHTFGLYLVEIVFKGFFSNTNFTEKLLASARFELGSSE